MGWEGRIVGDAALAPYLPAGARADFGGRVRALIAQQAASWPMLSAALAGLAQVEVKKFEVRGSEVYAQFNPKRIVSTAARVDPVSIQERPCFLCPENLPPEEKGIACGEDFILLCNPFPVLPHHLVIAARRHTAQLIEGSFAVMLDLAKALGADYFTLYNGPASGASAPDHLHFQAARVGPLPLPAESQSWPRRALSSRTSNLKFEVLVDFRLNLVIARGSDRDRLMRWPGQASRALAEVTGAAGEPLLNLIVTAEGDVWTVYLFPREKHRPACYYADGDRRLTVSPAAIDLAGVMVVPEAAHFARITAANIAQIYAEVTLADLKFARFLEIALC